MSINTPKRNDDTCPEGMHDVGKPPYSGGDRQCVVCGTLSQTIYADPRSAAAGDFRVVCTEPECDYGQRVDADGNGYTNHFSLALAKSALGEHQSRTETPHSAWIQQHPIDAVSESNDSTLPR